MPYYQGRSQRYGGLSGLGGLKSEVVLSWVGAYVGAPLAALSAVLRTGAAARKAAKHAKEMLILMIVRLKQLVGAQLELGKEIQRSDLLLNQAEILKQAAETAAATVVETPATATAGLGNTRIRRRR